MHVYLRTVNQSGLFIPRNYKRRLVYKSHLFRKKSFIQKNILAPRIKNIQVRIYILFVTIQYIYN